MKLRPYQQEAREAIHREWNKGNKRTLLVLPTGTGKTIVFTNVIGDRVAAGGSRCLILAHRGELLDQAADKLYKTTGLRAAVEKAEESSLDSFLPVTVGSIQSLAQPKRLEQFAPDHFGTIIVDEAHHAISESYQRVLQHFSEADVLGVTATPDRGDFKNLGTYFDSIAYEYSLPRAIKEGFLSPIRAQTIPLQLDLSSVKQSAGDFQLSDLGTALDPYLEMIADEMVQICQERKTVVFLPLIATSQRFCSLLNERGMRAAEVNGQSDDRADILAAFDRGDYNVLCNSMLLTEGWDCPSVDCIVVLRPTRVRSLYSQMVGRGTRLYPGKDHLLLLDFLWHTERLDLVHPAHLIAKHEEVAQKMTEKIEEDGGPVDLEMMEALAIQDVQAEREAALAEKLKKLRNRKRKFVDPLQYEISIQDEDLTNYVPTFGWEAKPVTEGQKKTLDKFGIDSESVDTSGKASMLIDRLIERSKAGLATPKQIRALERKGFKHVGQWSFQDANSMIERIAGNGWITPYGIDPETYVPASLKQEAKVTA